MDYPKLSPGKRYTLPRPISSADSLLLAEFATREKAAGRITAIVTADTTDAQRIVDELAFFAPDLQTVMFPDWETLPYDTFSPHQDLISERLATLWRIHSRATNPQATDTADVVLIPATTALYRLAPPSFLAGYTFHFKVKQKLDEAKFKSQLTLAGYNHVTQVVSPGEYAVRGGLIDLFPMGSLVPYRVDLFDDEVDSIRTFDPDSQRSLYPVPEVRLLPGREFPMDDPARAKFRSRWRELLEGDPTKSRMYKDIGNGVATSGIEYYLPLFFDDTATVFDYLGTEATIVLHGDLESAFAHFSQDSKERFRLAQGDPERPVLPPESLFLSAEQFYGIAKGFRQLAIRPAAASAEAGDELSIATANSTATEFAEFELLPALPPSAAWRNRSRSSNPTWWAPSIGYCYSQRAMAAVRACWTFCVPAMCCHRRLNRSKSFKPATKSWALPPPRWPQALPGQKAASTSLPKRSYLPPAAARANAKSKNRSPM